MEDDQLQVTFSAKDWMQGKDLPQRKPQIKLYTYGVRRTKSGELQAFWGRGVYEGNNALALHEMMSDSSDDVRVKAEALLEAWKTQPKPIPIPNAGVTLQPGVFCVHSDGGGHHNCLIIGRTEDPEPLFHALMLTTNPRWNPWCRKATEVEIAQLTPRSRLPSWLAPVSRPVSEFFLATRLTDPSTLARYQQEFAAAFQSPVGKLTPALKRSLNAWARWYSERQHTGHSYEQALFEALGRNPQPF